MSSGIAFSLNETDFAASLGLSLPVPAGLVRMYLPGSSAKGLTDLSANAVDASLAAPAALSAWSVDFGAESTGGNLISNLPGASAPKPPATIVAVGYNGVSFGNYDGAALPSVISMQVDATGAFKVNAQTGGMGATPTMALPAGYSTEWNFYAASINWVSGGSATKTLYYGRANSLTKSSATESAGAQSGVSSVGFNAPDRRISSGPTRKGALYALWNRALSDAEIATAYAWAQRYFKGRLSNDL